MRLSVADEFSRTPGARYDVEGEFSGESFRRGHLLPRVREAIATQSKLLVDLDGTAGYGTSFLEEAFGGLIRNEHIPYNQLLNVLELKSDEEEYLIIDIRSYMKEAADEQVSADRRTL